MRSGAILRVMCLLKRMMEEVRRKEGDMSFVLGKEIDEFMYRPGESWETVEDERKAKRRRTV